MVLVLTSSKLMVYINFRYEKKLSKFIVLLVTFNKKKSSTLKSVIRHHSPPFRQQKDVVGKLSMWLLPKLASQRVQCKVSNVQCLMSIVYSVCVVCTLYSVKSWMRVAIEGNIRGLFSKRTMDSSDTGFQSASQPGNAGYGSNIDRINWINRKEKKKIIRISLQAVFIPCTTMQEIYYCKSARFHF